MAVKISAEMLLRYDEIILKIDGEYLKPRPITMDNPEAECAACGEHFEWLTGGLDAVEMVELSKSNAHAGDPMHVGCYQEQVGVDLLDGLIDVYIAGTW